jgi:hypothetical protein
MRRIAVSAARSYVAAMQNSRKFRAKRAEAPPRPGLVPGCPGVAPLHDHALLPWRFHPLLHAADGVL